MISNLKLTGFKGATASFDFSAGNYITGPNFSGKSTLDQAIRACVLGYIPGAAKTTAGLKTFASSYPMSIEMVANDWNLGIAFEKQKSAIKQTRDETLAGIEGALTDQTRVLFDPELFFGLTDAARISKACQLVQSEGGNADAIAKAIGDLIESPESDETRQISPLEQALARWCREVLPKAATVNDLLADSEVFWKERKKEYTADKERMQKTTEGVSDLSAADAETQPRHEVEARRKEITAKIQVLDQNIGAAESNINAIAAHNARLAVLKLKVSKVGELTTLVETTRAKENDQVSLRDRLAASVTDLTRRVNSLEQAIAREDEWATRRADSAARAVGLAEAEKALADVESRSQAHTTAIADAQKQLDETRAALTAANAELRANSVKPIAQRDWSAEPFASAVDGEYEAEVGISKKGDCQTYVIIRWRPVAKPPTADERENAEAREYNLQQAVEEADASFNSASEVLARLLAQRSVRSAGLLKAGIVVDRIRVAVEQLKSIDANPVPRSTARDEIAASKTQLEEAQDECNRVKVALPATTQAFWQARTDLAAAQTAVADLKDLEDKTQVMPETRETIDEWKTQRADLADRAAELDAALQDITRAEQDRKRVEDAAKRRAEVEAQIKTVGKVIDLIAQKKQELVSGSIDVPLAIANKLAAGILRGPLVFEQGEIGMRVGDRFISSRGTFSGTEAAIVMMGLTAGLAHKSTLRVLILDEVGRLDTPNAARLFDNLSAMIADGDIDQFFVIGPTNPELQEHAAARAAVIELNEVTA